ncbi:hypothetical protein DPEC_G00149020 [Dallia pectoralis]|uniref:Uncharacterized protein n=1 Tax=Dallia pectoralis TaxID=75939 RepID=A0ACC2GJ73_DALPE|nr:hypothetical protein DPEC_G00149020 [Dallia pectoralis]
MYAPKRLESSRVHPSNKQRQTFDIKDQVSDANPDKHKYSGACAEPTLGRMKNCGLESTQIHPALPRVLSPETSEFDQTRDRTHQANIQVQTKAASSGRSSASQRSDTVSLRSLGPYQTPSEV